jgi:hypothetical protein
MTAGSSLQYRDRKEISQRDIGGRGKRRRQIGRGAIRRIVREGREVDTI